MGALRLGFAVSILVGLLCWRGQFLKAQEALSAQDANLVREIVDTVAENMYRTKRFHLIGSLSLNNFSLERNPNQVSATAELVMSVDHSIKFRRFCYHRNYVQNDELHDEPGWTSEFDRAGVRTVNTYVGRGEIPFVGSSLPALDPVELPMCCYERINSNNCVTGAFYQLCDPEKAIQVEVSEKASIVTFQISSGARAKVEFSKKQGGMPVRSTVFANLHYTKNVPKGLAVDDYNYVAYENACTWKEFDGDWFPVEVQADAVLRRKSKGQFPPPMLNMEYEFQWYIGDDISQEQSETLEPLKLKSLVEQKANVKK